MRERDDQLTDWQEKIHFEFIYCNFLVNIIISEDANFVLSWAET